MFRPPQQYTGPDWYFDQTGYDCYCRWVFGYPVLWWKFERGELGVDSGDYVAAWLDVQYKGIVDRAPDTDDTDNCGERQEPDNDISLKFPDYFLGGEALEFCVGGSCN